MVDMRSTLLRPQATEEARSTHWSLACAPSVRRPSNPGPPIEAQELRRRPNHRWPATTPSRNRACLGLWIGRSNAESVERHSTAKYAEAVHQYDNGEQSRHQRDPPTTCGLSVEIGETLGANCRCQRLCALPTSWQAFAQIHPHRTRPGVKQFIRAYDGPKLKGRRSSQNNCDLARNALHAWACALGTLGTPMPLWREKQAPALRPLLKEYCEYRRAYDGVSESTLVRDIETARGFLVQLRRAKKSIEQASA